MADPFALNEDGTARDPAAFRAAIKADPVKMEALEKEPEVAAVVLGEDDNAFQELIKSIFQVIGRRLVASREPPGPRPQQKVTGHLTGRTSDEGATGSRSACVALLQRTEGTPPF